MTQPNLDPDELPHEKDYGGTNYQDEDLEIRNDDNPDQRPPLPVQHRKMVRRPPPRKRHYED